MKKLLCTVAAASTLGILGGCMPMKQKPQMTPLQIQAMQTRTFKTTKRKAFDATMQVLQDQGYTIKSANFNTGFISAEGMTQSGSGEQQNNQTFWHMKILMGNQQPERVVSHQIKATAFLTTPSKHKVHVRVSIVNAQQVSINGRSPVERDKQMLNGEQYTRIFNRIRQSLFVGSAA